jgi:hypothetical protein
VIFRRLFIWTLVVNSDVAKRQSEDRKVAAEFSDRHETRRIADSLPPPRHEFRVWSEEKLSPEGLCGSVAVACLEEGRRRNRS